jgi:hypothetical protein
MHTSPGVKLHQRCSGRCALVPLVQRDKPEWATLAILRLSTRVRARSHPHTNTQAQVAAGGNDFCGGDCPAGRAAGCLGRTQGSKGHSSNPANCTAVDQTAGLAHGVTKPSTRNCVTLCHFAYLWYWYLTQIPIPSYCNTVLSIRWQTPKARQEVEELAEHVD